MLRSTSWVSQFWLLRYKSNASSDSQIISLAWTVAKPICGPFLSGGGYCSKDRAWIVYLSVPSQGLGLYPKSLTEEKVVSSAERRKSLKRAGVGRKKGVGKRDYVEGSRRWLKAHSLFSLSFNYSIWFILFKSVFSVSVRESSFGMLWSFFYSLEGSQSSWKKHNIFPFVDPERGSTCMSYTMEWDPILTPTWLLNTNH